MNEILEKNKDIKFEIKNDSLVLKWLKILIFVLIIVFEFIIIYSYASKFYEEKTVFKKEKTNIALIDIDGVIDHELSKNIIKKVDYVLKNKDNIKEVIITMNSPGGSPEASEEIMNAIIYLKSQLPVNMYIRGYAVSGGYYIASSVTPLKANKNSLVGSIGVIMPRFNFKPLADKVGVEEDNIAYGEYKQLLPIIGKVTENQKKYLKDNLLSKIYFNFLKSVSDNRKIDLEKLEEFAQGKVFIANDEKIQGVLVDEITSLTKIKNNIKSKYEEVEFKEILLEEKPSLKNLFNITINPDLNLKENSLFQKIY